MSRVGLFQRLKAVREAASKVNPFAARIHALQPATRLRYDRWRAECDAISARAEREGGPGASFALCLSDMLNFPKMPSDVARALEIEPFRGVPDCLSETDVADIWSDMVAGKSAAEAIRDKTSRAKPSVK